MMKRVFTLIEIIISLSILLLILTIAGMALSGVYSSWRKISFQEEQMKQYRVIDRIVETAFRNAVPFHWKDRNNKEILLFSGTTHSLFLTYLHRIDNHKDGGIRFLKLYLQDRNLIAEYRQYPYLEQDMEQISVVHEVLAKNVRALNFVYLDRKDHELELYEEWDCEQRKNIPMAIQVEIQFQSGTHQVWLRRTAGNSQFSEWGRRLKTQRGI